MLWAPGHCPPCPSACYAPVSVFWYSETGSKNIVLLLQPTIRAAHYTADLWRDKTEAEFGEGMSKEGTMY